MYCLYQFSEFKVKEAAEVYLQIDVIYIYI